jgi:hypothetical protein
VNALHERPLLLVPCFPSPASRLGRQGGADLLEKRLQSVVKNRAFQHFEDISAEVEGHELSEAEGDRKVVLDRVEQRPEAPTVDPLGVHGETGGLKCVQVAVDGAGVAVEVAGNICSGLSYSGSNDYYLRRGTCTHWVSSSNFKVASRASFPNEPGFSWRNNRSQGCKVRCASNHLIVGVYSVVMLQGVWRADVLLYFKCPTTKQMRCPVNAYAGYPSILSFFRRDYDWWAAYSSRSRRIIF